jgi:radical SAM superfamily enzyme YgiQ (UPF0313 family)
MNKEYEIVLISDVFKEHWPAVRPLGIYRIASHLREHNITVKTVNKFAHMNLDQFKRCIDLYVTNSTMLVGFGATVIFDYQTGDFFGVSTEEMLERIVYIKTRNPNVKIVVGGAQLDIINNEFLQTFKVIDYICQGQGENTMLAIYQHLKFNEKLVTTRIETPKIISEHSYPFNDFCSSKNTFTEDDDIVPGEAMPLEIARGCIFKCKYCAYDLTHKKFMDYTKTYENLRDEFIDNYKKFQIQHYYTSDDLINDSPEKVDMLLAVTESLPFRIYLGGYVRLDLLRAYPDMIEKLKRIGLVGCFFGIETINDKSGRAVGKGLGKKRVEEALQQCKDIWQGDVYIQAGFILGLPHDTPDTATELYEWGEVMISQGLLHKLNIQPLTISPTLGKSDINENPEKYGYAINTSGATHIFRQQKMVLKPKHIHDTADWETENYTDQQAINDADKYNFALMQQQVIPEYALSSFGLPMILAALPPELADQFVRYNTRAIPATPGLTNKFKNALATQYSKYEKNYLNKLLKLS